MSFQARNSNESEGTFIKSLLEKIAQDVQALSYRQLQMVNERDEYIKSKKSSHASSSRGNELYGEQSLKNEYYQPPPRRVRKEKKESPREVRIDLPHFHGKENVEIYLDWEMKVEQLFACHKVIEENKVPLATLSFQGNAMY